MAKYEAVGHDEESQDLPEKTFLSYALALFSSSLWVIHGLMLFLSLLFLPFSANLYFRLEKATEQNQIYSPLNDVVEYRIETWANEFNKHSPYTGPRRPELDAAWRDITHYGSGYHTSIGVFHQLHCLDYIRKVIYREQYTVINDDPDIIVMHVDHCINAVRLALQCHSDVGLMTYGWHPDFPSPYPDFTTSHKCRNFDKIKEWVLAHEANITGQLSHPIYGPYVSPI
ncbi:hypothetical protein N7540_005771 [Penicillium herquei]|nr:hypothetical protein N7540_005771 [Penicillium herquei]